MPIYEFHCSHCQQDSEILVRSTEWKGTPCPRCGSTRLTKKLSVFSSAVSGGDDSCPDARACAVNAAGGCCCQGRSPHSH